MKGGEKMLTEQQIIQLKQILLREKYTGKKRLEKNDEFNLQQGHPHGSVGELSSYDNHPADEGTELFERGKDLALRANI